VKIYIDRAQPLSSKTMGKIMRKFYTEQFPKLKKYKDYYEGKQEISRRVFSDPTKPNNKLTRNYTKEITENYLGYICGVPITYSSKDETDISPLLDVLEYNDYQNTDNQLLKNALIYGIAAELVYINNNN